MKQQPNGAVSIDLSFRAKARKPTLLAVDSVDSDGNGDGKLEIVASCNGISIASSDQLADTSRLVNRVVVV